MQNRVHSLDRDGHAIGPARPMIDPFGRAITYLRVSVTDRCDFRCVYCMAENMTFLPKADLLTLEELDSSPRACASFDSRAVSRWSAAAS
jgi:cyclic pyranopterin phosphate synthase